MYRWITITLLTVALISVSIWGYQTNKQKNDLYVQAENEYQRSFHELTYNMDVLNDQIGTSLAMNSPDKLSPQFVDIWRISSNAHANTGHLPMGLLPIHKTEQFLQIVDRILPAALFLPLLMGRYPSHEQPSDK